MNSGFFRKEVNALQLQIFYDDFEIANPLGSKAGIHKVGALYFTIRNLPFQYNSKCENIHLISLFLCKDLKNEHVNFNHVLHPLVNDIRALENVGVKVDSAFLKGTLVAIAHDNLGANTCIGFVASFRADHFCRFCKIHREDAKNICVEQQNLLRTQAEYNEMLSLNIGVSSLDHKTTKGIKSVCEINKLSHYKMFESLNVDAMHDILEGAVPFILKLFFQKLLEFKHLTLNEINDKIKSFNYGFLQNTCIPPKITLDKKCRTSIGLSASQNLCLILHFPLIFFDFYDKMPHFWEGITSLLRVLRTVLSTVVKQEHIDSLRSDIELHLKCIVEVYQKTLLPKHHFLTHYATVFKRIGPLIHTWAMRYEAKHREFIRDVPIINNYKNICKTLAIRYQKRMSVAWENMTFKNEFIFHKMYTLLFEDLDVSAQNYFLQKFSCNEITKILITNKFECKFGYMYKIEFIIYLRKEVEYLTFGKIVDIYVINNDVYLRLETFVSKHFDLVAHCYEISPRNAFEIVRFTDLQNIRPYEFHVIKNKMLLLVPNLLIE